MVINGEKLDLKELKFSDYLKQKKLRPELIALELNGQIISRSDFDLLVLKENDKAEVVSFVGGG